ncbi:MAG: hypothetical protein AAFR52_03950, partial [Pseudomonadota bacterium]
MTAPRAKARTEPRAKAHTEPGAKARTGPVSLPARAIARLLALPIRAYRLVLSPWVGMHCRFR